MPEQLLYKPRSMMTPGERRRANRLSKARKSKKRLIKCRPELSSEEAWAIVVRDHKQRAKERRWAYLRFFYGTCRLIVECPPITVEIRPSEAIFTAPPPATLGGWIKNRIRTQPATNPPETALRAAMTANPKTADGPSVRDLSLPNNQPHGHQRLAGSSNVTARSSSISGT